MKRTLLVLLALSLFALPLLAQMPTPTDEELEQMGITREQYEEMLGRMQAAAPSSIEAGPYHSDEYGFTIDVMEGWTARQAQNAFVMFDGDIMDMASEPMAMINIVVVPDTDAESEENFQRAISGELSDAELKQMVMEAPGNDGESGEFELLDVGNETLSGHPAMMIESRVTEDFLEGQPMVFHSIMYMLIKDEMQYNLVYMAPESEWPAFQGKIPAHRSTFVID